MSRQNQIPTTEFVPPFPTDAPQEQMNTWSRSVAGFCNGSQVVKKNNDIRSTRTGVNVFISGTLIIESGTSSLNVLPVKSRTAGFIQSCDSSGNIKGLPFAAESKELNVSGLDAGTYTICGWYIAQSKEKI